jgi:hypothetical protein
MIGRLITVSRDKGNRISTGTHQCTNDPASITRFAYRRRTGPARVESDPEARQAARPYTAPGKGRAGTPPWGTRALRQGSTETQGAGEFMHRQKISRDHLPTDMRQTSSETLTVVIESVEPHGAVVRGQRPLPHYDRHSYALHGHQPLSVLARVLLEPPRGVFPCPRLVDVRV